MKKIILLVASVLLYGNLANASAINYADKKNKIDFSQNDPIEFTERGIAFYVFPNGEFDFNTTPTVNSEDYYRRSANSANETSEGRRKFVPENNGVRIEHDAMGRVRRIGNVFINYDFQNRIKRIGTVYMSYNRFALEQIGGLKIIYNRKGQIINMYGSVNGCEANYYSPYSYQYDSYFNTPSNNSQYYYRKAKTDADDK
jgi:hypothetical protein